MNRGDYKRIGLVMQELGISRATLKRWEKKSMIRSARDHSGTRYYSQEEIKKMKDLLQPK